MTKMGKLENYTSMENQQIIFYELFLHFVFTLLVFLAQINVSYKSYGCVDGIHANKIDKIKGAEANLYTFR